MQALTKTAFVVTDRTGKVLGTWFDRVSAEAFSRSINHHYAGTDQATAVIECCATVELPDQVEAVSN